MQIRQANQTDIPGILNVLKASLGETSSKKTDEVWRYKHLDNPFGESLVLIAEEAEIIIGVRAFMRWQWKRGEKIYSAFRAVDTATHPDHQGKGIFKKLTLAALKLGEESKEHFIFNTPNSQSKPGYLKMGWVEVGKLHTIIVPNFPFYWNPKYPIDYPVNLLGENPELLERWNNNLFKSGRLFTPKTREYLNWRYIRNPLQNYRVEATENYFIAGYVKKQKKLKELRISELILFGEGAKKDCKKLIKNWAKEYGVHFISFNDPSYLNLFSLKVSGSFGPALTYKELENNRVKYNILEIKKWANSLGDLELF